MPSRSAGVLREAVTRATTYCLSAGLAYTPRTTSMSWRTVPASVTGRSRASGSALPCWSSMAISAAFAGYPIDRRAMNRSRCASGNG